MRFFQEPTAWARTVLSHYHLATTIITIRNIYILSDDNNMQHLHIGIVWWTFHSKFRRETWPRIWSFKKNNLKLLPAREYEAGYLRQRKFNFLNITCESRNPAKLVLWKILNSMKHRAGSSAKIETMDVKTLPFSLKVHMHEIYSSFSHFCGIFQ